jgi:hypothetical protein
LFFFVLFFIFCSFFPSLNSYFPISITPKQSLSLVISPIVIVAVSGPGS